jgi:hypothetical protein
MAEGRTITIVSPTGVQTVVNEEQFRKDNPDYAKAHPVVVPVEAAAPPVTINPELSESYIKAHGPAEPIRGRYVPAEQQHPGLAFQAAMGETPMSAAIESPGANVPADFPDPNVTQSPEEMRTQLEAAGLVPDGTDDVDEDEDEDEDE